MRGLRIGCIIGVWVLVLTVSQSFSQEDMRVVDNSVFERPVRVSSLFEHDVHNETAGLDDCSVCHHLYEDGKLIEDESSEDQSCADCHPADGSGSTPSLRRAYHLNCKGCHMSNRTGPVMCAQCHRDIPAAGTPGE
jgi:hypothetical protein